MYLFTSPTFLSPIVTPKLYIHNTIGKVEGEGKEMKSAFPVVASERGAERRVPNTNHGIREINRRLILRNNYHISWKKKEK